MLQFINSEKATKFSETFSLLLSYVVPVKSKLKISQNFVAFSEYMNFKVKIFSIIFGAIVIQRNDSKLESRNLYLDKSHSIFNFAPLS